MLRTYYFKVIDAKLGVSVEGPYSYLARSSDNKVFEYFLNPAAYSGVSGQVYFDGTNYYVPGASELDDRYSVGKNTRLVFGGSTANAVLTPTVDISQYTLTTLYKNAFIRPYLVVRVYEPRLASYSYFAIVYEQSYANLVTDTAFTDEDDFVAKFLNPEFLKSFLLSKLAPFITANGGTVDLAKQEFDIKLETDFQGEYATSVNSGHLSQGSYFDSMLSYVTHGNSKIFSAYRLTENLEKPFTGMYTVVQRPEKLLELNKVVATAVESLITALKAASTTTDPSPANEALLREVLNRVLSEKVNDYFRGTQYKVVVGYDGSGNPIYQYVNVSLAFHGSPNGGLALVQVGANKVYAVPVNFGDTFATEVLEAQKAHPKSLSYITGPYGSLPVYDDAGNLIGYYSDAYTK